MSDLKMVPVAPIVTGFIFPLISTCSLFISALRYWSDGPGNDPRWCHLGFFPWFLPTKPCALRSTQPL